MTEVRVEGLEELLRKLDDINGLRAAVRAMRVSAVHLKGKVAIYPPATAANMPGPYPKRWYQRGFGPRWARKNKPGVGGSKTSETLGRKWTVAERNSGLTQVVGNNVSYGQYVQDKEKQAKAHRAHNWKTIQDVVEEETRVVLNLVKSEVDKVLKG